MPLVGINRSRFEMNELAKQFIKYLREASIHSRIGTANDLCAEYAFIVELFSESKKRRMNEGEKDLILDAAAALIEEHREDFNAWRAAHVVGFCHRFAARDCEIMALELASHFTHNELVKRIAVQWLRDNRAELFNDSDFKTFLDEGVVEHHPMQTFVFWLDYIEGMKGTTDYPKWLALKRNLTNLLRVGNAVLKRSEWQSVATLAKG